jgi:hypothetical protein
VSDAITNLIPPERREGWRWWEARRLRYNVALALAGWAAYALYWLLLLTYAAPRFVDGRMVLAQTLFLGAGYLVVMGAANIFYLLGVLTESIAKPEAVEHFRERTWAIGFWGSIALPFLFPLMVFAVFLAQSGPP